MKMQIVFTEPGSIFGKFVRLMLGGKWTHVHFLFISDKCSKTYEAFPPFVRFKNGNLYEGQGEALDLPMEEHHCMVIARAAEEAADSVIYGASDALRIFIRNRISKRMARMIGNLGRDPHTETCSTLAIRTLRLMWPDFGGEDGLEFSPDEVYAAVMEKQESGW